MTTKAPARPDIEALKERLDQWARLLDAPSGHYQIHIPLPSIGEVSDLIAWVRYLEEIVGSLPGSQVLDEPASAIVWQEGFEAHS